jgi:hypothetical protein
MKHTFVLCLDLEGGVFDLFNLISHTVSKLALSELVRSRIKADKFKTATPMGLTFAEKLVG